jgi:hypothetical protein
VQAELTDVRQRHDELRREHDSALEQIRNLMKHLRDSEAARGALPSHSDVPCPVPDWFRTAQEFGKRLKENISTEYEHKLQQL